MTCVHACNSIRKRVGSAFRLVRLTLCTLAFCLAASCTTSKQSAAELLQSQQYVSLLEIGDDTSLLVLVDSSSTLTRESLEPEYGYNVTIAKRSALYCRNVVDTIRTETESLVKHEREDYVHPLGILYIRGQASVRISGHELTRVRTLIDTIVSGDIGK